MTAKPGQRDSAGVDEEFIERRDGFFRLRDHFETLFRRVIDEGIKSGEFRTVDAAVFTRAMLGAHNWVGVWYRPDGRLSGKEIAAIMADTFLTSLVNHREQGEHRQKSRETV
jgi:TetR/AcrR family transcriptional regulator, cholesterol catabolism regulator